MKHCTHHAAERWAQRVMGIDKPSAFYIERAREQIAEALETARVTRRFRNRTRVLVTTGGAHLVMCRGGTIVTALGPGQPQAGCHCEYCMRVRADKERRRRDG